MKFEKGQEITINIPFTYTIGEEGFHSGKELNTLADCLNEIRAEIDEDALSEGGMAEFEGNTYDF
jgi:hypothetical protein